jgi:hypothetical protein
VRIRGERVLLLASPGPVSLDNCTTGDAAVPWRQTAIGPPSPASGPFVLAALQAMDLHSTTGDTPDPPRNTREQSRAHH